MPIQDQYTQILNLANLDVYLETEPNDDAYFSISGLPEVIGYGKHFFTLTYKDQEWPLSLSSGMEKFVSSLALRVGLINVSNLPSPNFLVIDEGFGTLDTDNLSNMKGAFDYLKTRFDSVFIISHLDTIKDFMDYLLPINVNNNKSSVIYN